MIYSWILSHFVVLYFYKVVEVSDFMKKQLEVLEKEIQVLKDNKKVEAVLLTGSVAYGAAVEDSDLDLIVIADENNFVSKYTDDILVEIHFHKYNTLVKNLESNSIDVYNYLYSKIIFDNGKLEKLIARAKAIYNNYCTPSSEKEEIFYWLSSTKLKLTAAINSKDESRMSYLISTNTWKVLEGVWAMNNKPMPPSSLTFAKYNDLEYIPFDNWFNDLLIGDGISRARAMIKIIDWICNDTSTDLVCKVASIDEMETKWNYEIKKHKSHNWEIWKSEAIERVKNGQCIAYYGILNGTILCEATAMLDKNIVQNYEGLVDNKTVYLCAFRTIEKYRGKGYFSNLFKFMIGDLKSKGYEKVTLGVEPTETENLKIYKHLGFDEFIKSAQETYPDGTVIDVDYYGMKL